jgi:4'-phosphopantetheinyl transferase
MRNSGSQYDDQDSVWIDEHGESFDGSLSVHLWTGHLDCDEFSVQQLQLLLSEAERERSLKYRFEVDRNRFIVRRGRLRRILAGYLRNEPQAVQFRTGEFGKLCLADSSRSLEFSVTHSQAMALFAVTQAGTVGVDLECVRPLPDLEMMIDSCLSPSERGTLETFPATSRLEYFYRHWTCKEAYLKAIGVGLDRPLTSVEVLMNDASSEDPVTLRVAGEECPDFAVRTFVPFEGYVAAMVTPQACRPHTLFEI